MGDSDFAKGIACKNRLTLIDTLFACGGVAIMPDSGEAHEICQNLWLKDLGYKPIFLIDCDFLGVASGDTAGFLQLLCCIAKSPHSRLGHWHLARYTRPRPRIFL